MFRSLCLLLGLIFLGAAWAAPTPPIQKEIQHLLRYLETSGCQFYRNGRWYEAPDARAHIEKKYNYLLKKNWVDTTEEFIERAASKSSISGEAYRVKCDRVEATSGAWLARELQRYRDLQNTRGEPAPPPR